MSKRLMTLVRERLRVKHYSYRTEQSYCHWIKAFIRFHKYRHPHEMGEAEVTEFLTWLAVHRQVAANTQNQAFSSLAFLYREVLDRPLENINAIRAKPPQKLPVSTQPHGNRYSDSMLRSPYCVTALVT